MIETRLRQLRLELGLTQAQVAEQLGITRGSYTYYENGNRQPRPELLIRLADFYQVSIDYLAGRTDYPGSMPEPDSSEVTLLECFRPVDARGKSVILDIARYESRRQKNRSDSDR